MAAERQLLEARKAVNVEAEQAATLRQLWDVHRQLAQELDDISRTYTGLAPEGGAAAVAPQVPPPQVFSVSAPTPPASPPVAGTPQPATSSSQLPPAAALTVPGMTVTPSTPLTQNNLSMNNASMNNASMNNASMNNASMRRPSEASMTAEQQAQVEATKRIFRSLAARAVINKVKEDDALRAAAAPDVNPRRDLTETVSTFVCMNPPKRAEKKAFPMMLPSSFFTYHPSKSWWLSVVPRGMLWLFFLLILSIGIFTYATVIARVVNVTWDQRKNPSTVQIRTELNGDKQLYVNGKVFRVRGINYSPIAKGQVLPPAPNPSATSVRSALHTGFHRCPAVLWCTFRGQVCCAPVAQRSRWPCAHDTVHLYSWGLAGRMVLLHRICCHTAALGRPLGVCNG